MSRIPAWLYALFGVIAVVAGILGMRHAPSGVPKVFWALVTVGGVASLTTAGVLWRRATGGR